MANKILHKRSLTAGSIPTTSSLDIGEIALNVSDGKVYIHKSGSQGESIESAITSNSTSSIGILTLSGSLILSGSTEVNSGTILDISSHNILFDFDYLSFSGSAEITGSLIVSDHVTSISGFTGSLFGTSSWANNAITASYVSNTISASYALTASYVQTAQTASYVLQAVSASYSTTASFAVSSSYSVTASHALNILTPGGSDTQIQYNNGSVFGGSSNLTFNPTKRSLVHGDGNLGLGQYSYAQGNTTTASGSYSHTEGGNTQAIGTYSHAEGGGPSAGEGNIAIGDSSHAEGTGTITYGSYSHAEGRITTASGSHSHAEGYATIASGSHSHAEGASTIAIGENSHAEGSSTTSLGASSHAEGFTSQALGDFSHAEGAGVITGTTSAYSSTVSSGLVTLDASYGDVTPNFTTGNTLILYDAPFDGLYGKVYYTIDTVNFNGTETEITLTDNTVTTTTAYIWSLGSTGDQIIPGNGSHAEGSSTQAIGDYSHAEGVNTQAIGEGSHAEGGGQAIGPYSHAEGVNAKAVGNGSHAEGRNTITKGLFSHGEGFATITEGDYSHAEGNNTITSGSYQLAVGQYNTSISDQSAFIIGDGVDDNNRHNLLVAASGSVILSGSLLVDGSTTSTSFTGSLYGTASWAENTTSASYASTASLLLNNTIGEFNINFGSTPGTNTVTTTISNLSVKNSSYINIYIMSTSSIDHNSEDHKLFSLYSRTIPGNIIENTSFDVTCITDLRINGIFKAKYIINNF